ncbi:WG repeat-containing protein [Nostocaceae cyanobacterium CENA369]|uniref:WG repeat-containing protein n=1 Tax=Dendronalium phyllosphericum CENA369 TaxID=1725256 RepID=A0A8J7LJI5_9NOST|nr:WG repeat-containing protein [Dendronalium phyllosphericum]MBH8577549.1 WG repeat-containing protein [Dendronalium phyllosphericum CENA369]
MIGYILQRRYKIINKLGSGGFGETYLAEYPENLPVSPKYKCVVKRLIRPPTPDLDTEERFKKEAAILFKLGKDNPQIPELYDFFEENKEFYLVQEFIEGHDLSNEIISGKPWSEAHVIQLLQEILEVLTFVHEKNVIHRDIKPLNLMRRYSDNKLVLIDFGIVKEISALGVNAQGKISSTIPIGTRGYMPSEQFHGHPKLCSDIYALGMTAIQALTGVSPQELRIDPDTLEVVWQEKAQASNPLIEILTKMVRYSSHQRYSDACEALQALKQASLVSSSLVISPKPIKIVNKYGYIDQTGRVIIPAQFDDAWSFFNNLAIVKIGSKFGYIDRIGQLVIPPQFDDAWYFYEGLARVKIGEKFAYIVKSGRIVIPPQFDDAEDFSEGLARVKIGDKLCHIGKSGQTVIESEFEEIWGFTEGLARVKINRKFGYIGKSGQLVIQPQFDGVGIFSEGLARVMISKKFGYIDKIGQLVIQLQFDDAGDFFEELARVKINRKWNYIDKTGQLVISAQFDNADDFSDGLAKVKINRKWGYIDKTGQLVISAQFDDADDFSDGLAMVNIGNQERYIDKTGRFICQVL